MRFTFTDIIQKFIILCLGIFLFILFFHKGIETEDVWFHLKTGQWIINHCQLPHQDLFPFANEKTPYLSHEWVASSSLYLIFKAGGLIGLKLFRALFFMSTIGIFFIYSYRRIPFSFLIFLILLMSYALFQRSLLRPDTFNLLFVQVFLISLFSYEKAGGRWKLFLLPLVGVFWINIHMMGAFIYGGSIIFIFLLSALIRSFNHQSGYDAPRVVISPKVQIKELSLIFLIYQTAFIINPYGVEGLLFPYKVILFPHYYGFYKMMTVMRELQNSLYIFSSFEYFYFILLILFPVWILWLSKKRDFTLIFLFNMAFIAFLYMNRNSSFFTLIAAYVIVHSAQNMGLTKMWTKIRFSALMDILILSGVTFWFLIQSFNICNERVFYNGKEHRSLFLATNPYVISSIKLLKDNGVTGPIFNSSILGGSIIWFDYPQLRPVDDGRHLDYQRFNDYIEVLSNPQKSWNQVQKVYDFKTVILNQGNNVEQKVIQYISTQKDWQLIAVRGPFVIFVKRGEFHLSDEQNAFEQRLKSDVLSDEDKKQLQTISQREPRGVLEKFLNPSPYRVDLFSDGVTLMGLGYNGAAAKDFMGALKISDQSYMREIVNAFLKQLK